jgi:hypothetical protein
MHVNATATHEEFSMRKQEFFNYSRRALLGASGALALFAALRPRPIFAQASGGKLRIGIIGSGHIGGAIGGLWVKAGHPVTRSNVVFAHGGDTLSPSRMFSTGIGSPARQSQ